jgi:acyl transferase domain-containing protein/acyl-CoA synthetase (AMP-forming)/AMP-acid ligase II/acyl carrier protein
MSEDVRAGAPQTLLDLLRQRAEHCGDKVAFTYSLDGEEEHGRLTYGELDTRARAIAAALQQQGAAGERVLVLCPSGLDFIAGMFGCFYAGTVAIPVHPPVHSRLISRVAAIVADSRARFVLTTAEVQSELKPVLDDLPEGGSLLWCAADTDTPEHATDWVAPEIDSDATAFIQYTSGSTGTPKGVDLTHRNLLANLDDIGKVLGLGDDVKLVSWLPLHHDMGLIGCVFGLLYAGGTCFLMPPSAFISRPMRWLEAISRCGANISVAPNFAFELCVERSTAEERAALELSNWTGAYCGAEPVRVATMQRFADAFAPAGFGRDSFHPVYGLAEATLFVSGTTDRTAVAKVRRVDSVALRENNVIEIAPEHPAAATVVGCGPVAESQEVVIVDPATHRQCGADEIGEIWVSGANVARGYLGKPAETEETFAAFVSDTGAGPFLRTGDLGFLLDGELFVAGRLKDLVIIRGRNYYPNDIEFTAQETNPGLLKGRGAAFAITPESGGSEQLVVVQEINREHLTEADVDQVIAAIRTAITAEHQIKPHAVLLVDALRIPTTSSGKIRRRACRDKFLDGGLETFGVWRAPAAHEPQPTAPTAKDSGVGHSADEIAAWFVSQLCAELDLSPTEVDTSQPFAFYGLDSVRSIQLMTALEAWLGCKTSPTLTFDYPTIELLAGHLAGDVEDTTPAATPRADRGVRAESADEPIAIVGIGCRFPGAEGPADFWRMLCDGVDAVSEVPADRWDVDTPERATGRWGGFLDQVDQFDAQFFGISPREASRMDPQQRLLLEVAWEALEDAGQVPDQLAGSRTGVFTGLSTNEYQHLTLSRPELIDAYSGTGSSTSIAANRLSYFFDFRGPSMAVDTACSSSLVAIHLACRSLRDGESTLALAGGVNLMLTPGPNINFAKAGVLAADGRCKTFDAKADGWVRGEGAGIVVLKPLSRALADGDSIYAVIRGSAMNQDGRTNGLMAPSRLSQEEVLTDAYERAGLSPGVVQYVELQGLGTLLGDAIEAEALGTVLADSRAPDSPCIVGSVKTNIGHLEGAAGVAGVIKVALALRHRAIPPTLNFSEPNPNIPFDRLPLQVAQSLTPWPDHGGRTVAGVSAFGFGGTNAHIVLAEAPQVRATEPPDETAGRRAAVLPLSARSPEAVMALAGRYELALAGGAPVAELCHTAATRRGHHDHRLAVVGGSRDELCEALAAYRHGVPHPAVVAGRRRLGQRPGVVFLFSGEGSHWCGMGQQLYEQEPAFRDALAMCDRAMRPYLETDLLTELLAAPTDWRVDDDLDIAMPAVFGIQVALAALWRSWGIEPSAVIGHSLGEVAAAHVTGALSLDDAAQLICARSRLLRRTSDRVAVGELRDVLAGLHATPTKVPMYSTVTGDVVDSRRLLDDTHWMANLRSPVDFSSAVRRLIALGSDAFLELGPHPTLLGAVQDDTDGSGRTITLVPSMRSDEPERATMLAALGGLYASGESVAWEQLQPWGGHTVAAPTYPWQRQRYWLGDDGEGPAPVSLQASDRPPTPLLEIRHGIDIGHPTPIETLEVAASLTELLRTASGPERRRLLESYLRDAAADKLGIAPSLLDVQSPLNHLGVDSLMAGELRASIERDVGVVVPVVQLLDGPSVASLTDWLGATLSGPGPWRPDPTVPAHLLVTTTGGAVEETDLAGSRWIDLLAQVPDASDDDVDALLREVLAAQESQDD